jgi:RNA polymerase sigma-70 factor (ECF subfamily)
MSRGTLMNRPSGDAAFRRLFDIHHPAVLAYCLRRAGREDAQDAAAEVFAVAWRRLGDVPDSDGTLPWLYGTARRVLANQRRGRARSRRLSNRLAASRAEPPATPEVIILRREQDQLVLDAIGRLRDGDREVIRLALWERLPHAAIGKILGCSDRAVTMRLNRAVQRLRRELHHSVTPLSTGPKLAPDPEAIND